MDDLMPDATKTRIKTAFSKSMTGSKKSRKLLTDIATKIAVGA